MERKMNAVETPDGLLFWNNLQKLKNLLGLILCVGGISLTAAAAPSDLDTTFGDGGKVIWSPNGAQNARGSKMALQPDGKILMVGSKSPLSQGFYVVRFNASGSLDTTFGGIGWVTLTFGGSSNEAGVDVAIQPDGKIVVGGHATFPSSGTDLGVTRINADGTVDTTFGTNGIKTVGYTGPNGAYGDYLYSLKIAGDGKIVIAGSALGLNVDQRVSLTRLNPNGSLDSSFGSGGKLLDGGYAFTDLVVQPDGSIFAVGNTDSQSSDFQIAGKYSPTGTREWIYTRGQDFVRAVFNGAVVQPNGKFIAAGYYQGSIDAKRFNADGTVDATFNVGTATTGRATAAAIQSDGKILVSFTTDASNTGHSLIRFNTDGSIDTTFGSGGTFRTTFPNNTFGVITKIIVQPDGKFLLGGNAYNHINGNSSFVLARLLGESAAPRKALFDYDGDGKADVSVFRASENKWYILQSSNFALVQTVFAIAGDVAAPGDYDGDGKTDVAIFRPSTGSWWYQSSINNAQVNVGWGQAGDIPRPSDFDGDGKTDFIVYRPSNSVWYRYGSTGVTSILAFGIAEDKPLVGDFDGDGKADQAIFRPSTGDWWYASSVSGQFVSTHWGASGDVPVAADYDGDGKTDLAVYRPSSGGWYIYNSSNGSVTVQGFGLAEDKPIAADYDGDGKADIAVYRPSNGTWYLLQTTAGFGAVQLGNASDLPTENAFIQ